METDVNANAVEAMKLRVRTEPVVASWLQMKKLEEAETKVR